MVKLEGNNHEEGKAMNLRVDIYSCNDCGRAVIVEEDEVPNHCPHSCHSDDLEYSHSGYVVND